MIKVPETAAEIQAMIKRIETAQMRHQVEAEQALKKLKELFDVDDVEEAKQLLRVKQAQYEKAKNQLGTMRKAFETKWQSQLAKLN